MADRFKEGDRVQIAEREATAEDVKSGLYYPHFGGLTGIVQKVYETGDASIEVDLTSLPEEVAHRHEEMRLTMQTKWLDGLSEEARNRLSDAERNFNLRYTLLTSVSDLCIPTLPAAKETSRLTSADLDAQEAAEIERRLRKV
jgi:ribosomal protein L21E